MNGLPVADLDQTFCQTVTTHSDIKDIAGPLLPQLCSSYHKFISCVSDNMTGMPITPLWL